MRTVFKNLPQENPHDPPEPLNPNQGLPSPGNVDEYLKFFRTHVGAYIDPELIKDRVYLWQEMDTPRGP